MSNKKTVNDRQSQRNSIVGIIGTSICIVIGYYVYKKTKDSNKYEPKTFYIKNPMVAMVGITNYDGNKKPWVNLPGIAQDTDKITNLWNGYFNYNVNILTDYDHQTNKQKSNNKTITLEKIHNFFREIRDCLYKNDNYDSLICILSGHGHNGSLITSNKEYYQISSMKDYFCCKAFPFFSNKPKIFIVDICRSHDIDHKPYSEQPKWRNMDDDQDNIHPYCDICMIYSNTKYYPVPENDDGSPMIQCLFDVMKSANLITNDLNNIIIMLADKLAKKTSLLCVESVSTNKYLIYFKKNIKEKGNVIVNGEICNNNNKPLSLWLMIKYMSILACISFATYFGHCMILTHKNQSKSENKKHHIPSFIQFVKESILMS